MSQYEPLDFTRQQADSYLRYALTASGKLVTLKDTSVLMREVNQSASKKELPTAKDAQDGLRAKEFWLSTDASEAGCQSLLSYYPKGSCDRVYLQ